MGGARMSDRDVWMLGRARSGGRMAQLVRADSGRRNLSHAPSAGDGSVRWTRTVARSDPLAGGKVETPMRGSVLPCQQAVTTAAGPTA